VPQSTVDGWLASAPADQAATLRRLREMILAAGDDVEEEIKWSRPCYSVGAKLFAYLDTAARHVTLGFQQGAHLEDPQGLLQGTGKDLRHVKVKAGEQPDEAAVGDLIRLAYARSRG